MIIRLMTCLVLAGFLLPVAAHHSFSMFDNSRELVLEGEVKEFQWSNPHTWIQLNVTDASGKVVEWSIEGGSPNLVGRQGWKRNTFKPGDAVRITVHPLRDGRPGGSFVRAVLPDGRTLGGNQIPAAPATRGPQAPPAAAAPADRAALQRQREELNRRPDTPGTGAYPAMKEEIPALPRHVVYRPARIAAMGAQKLGVVAWGNGGCSDDAASARFHLLELASHGHLVIASGRILSGPGAPPPSPAQKPFPRTETADLTAAIDWALAENARQGSPYFGRIDPKQVAVSGFSCGGLQAALVAGDPRVTAVIMQNTGTYEGERSTMPGLKVPKSTLKNFHTPVLYIIGGPTDVAYANAMDDFRLIDHVPVAVANLPVGHGGTYNEPNGGAAAQVAVDWLAWQWRGDPKAAARFVGEQCGLCTDAEWTLERRNFPAR